jgi:hypothetical protein
MTPRDTDDEQRKQDIQRYVRRFVGYVVAGGMSRWVSKIAYNLCQGGSLWLNSIDYRMDML